MTATEILLLALLIAAPLALIGLGALYRTWQRRQEDLRHHRNKIRIVTPGERSDVALKPGEFPPRDRRP